MQSLIVPAAIVFAVPFGWGLGAVLAYLVAGKSMGQLPLATVPLGVIAAIVFAALPSIKPSTRLRVTFFGTLAFIFLALVLAWLKV